MDFSNFKIATKIGAGFATIVAMIIALGATAWFQLGAVAAGEAQLAVHNLPNVEMAGQIQSLVNAIRRLEARHVLSYDLKDKDALEQEMATDRQQLASIDPIASSRYASAQEQKAWSDYLVHRQQWYAEWDKLRPFSRKSNESQEAQDFAAKAFNSDSQAKFTLSLNDVQALSDYNRKVGAEAWTEGQQTIQVARWTVLIAIALAVLLAVALALVIAGAIARPIAAAVQVAGAIAQGDMTVSIAQRGRDETAQLLHALAGMRSGLVRVVSDVRKGSESVALASAEIAKGNQDLSARTEHQASALQQTAASMEELSEQVQHNAANAQQANQLASSASAVAVRGGQVVERVVGTMRDINSAAKKIADIIGVIDGIAFQTNILALNAAVEAARAGEQGRGFAVVASEVRSLAGRSADAAKEIKSLIHASVERVEQGTLLVDEAGSTMTEVVDAIRMVSVLVGEINAASKQQASGVAQVGAAVRQMDQTTQQNAALVEQMAAAGHSLNSQASALVEVVSVFRLERQELPLLR